MGITFAIIAALTLVSAVAAMSLRNLVHCALSLAITFVGLAAMYLQLDAQFVGFAQILVYVGAVAILIVFAILLTRSGQTPQPVIMRSAVVGVLVALLVFGVMMKAIVSSKLLTHDLPAKPVPTVRQIGNQLMTRYVLPLEGIGLLLTAATIGAVILAMSEKKKNRPALEEAPEVHVNGSTREQTELNNSKT